MRITKLQKDNMEHALGLDYNKFPFRNRYCTYSPNESWKNLIEKGLADVFIEISNGKTYYFYYVTKKGQEFLGLNCDCSELGCQNKFYKNSRLTPVKELPYCRKHYNMYK